MCTRSARLIQTHVAAARDTLQASTPPPGGLAHAPCPCPFTPDRSPAVCMAHTPLYQDHHTRTILPHTTVSKALLARQHPPHTTNSHMGCRTGY